MHTNSDVGCEFRADKAHSALNAYSPSAGYLLGSGAVNGLGVDLDFAEAHAPALHLGPIVGALKGVERQRHRHTHRVVEVGCIS